MEILIDTNILIHLEDHKIIQEEFSRFYQIAISNKCKVIYLHDAVLKDISRDKDQERRDIILSKLAKYEQMNDFAEPSSNFLSRVKNDKINDKIDNEQLFQVYKRYVDFFVSEDKGIHKKAEMFGIEGRVLNIQDAISMLERKFSFQIPKHPILSNCSVREIEKYFDSAFFDSLKADYGEEKFIAWLQKCAEKNRQCYVFIAENELLALLIYNVENVEDHKIPKLYTRAVKICTLKVSDDAIGINLGELFLNKMFALCVEQGIKTLYLTVYDKQKHLIRLLRKFGFQQNEFINSQGVTELRMIKSLDKDVISCKENSMKIHPFYFDESFINKYVIPIRPEFYITLFKDGGLREPTLFDMDPYAIENEIHGNTIVKAYISNARIKRLRKGDLLFFYSSKTHKVIEPVGVLEDFYLVDKFDDLWSLVRKKTVFSQEELRKMLNEKSTLHVIIFRLVTYLNKLIDLEKIKQIPSLKNKIPTITQLQELDYQILKREDYFDKRYIIN